MNRLDSLLENDRAWARRQEPGVHGWNYGLRDGLRRDLECGVDGPGQIAEACRIAP